MDQTQMITQAKKMFLENKGRRDVITFFKMQGVEEAQAENMATEAYKSIREVRQALMAEAANQRGDTHAYETSGVETDKTGAIISLVLGLLICFGGIAASMGTNRIFYGAVLVGGMMALKGIAGLVS